MANKKISDLASGSALDGSELIEIEQSGVSAQSAINGILKTYLDGLYAKPRAEWMADSHAGYGSTATKIPYFTNVNINVDTASAMTVVNNSTDGCKATINIAGHYAVTYWSDPSAIGDSMGISVNGTPTTNIQSITASQRRAYGQCGYPTAGLTVSTIMYLAVNDVVRPHADAHAVATAAVCGFSICRVG